MEPTAVTLTGAVASFIASALWLRGSLIEVPEDVDTFIAAHKRVGRWNAYAARAAVAAALCAFVSFLKIGM